MTIANPTPQTTVVSMQQRNGERDEMDHRTIVCFDQALADVGLAAGRSFVSSAVRLLRLNDDGDGVRLPPSRR